MAALVGEVPYPCADPPTLLAVWIVKEIGFVRTGSLSKAANPGKLNRPIAQPSPTIEI